MDKTPRTEFLCGEDTPLSHMCALVLKLAPAGSGQAGAAAGCNAHWSAVRAGMAQLETDLAEAVVALKELKQEVDNLSGIEYTRDIAPYRAEAIWNDVCGKADGVLAKHSGER